MKKLLLILLCLPMIGFGQLTYVPDNTFEYYLENNGINNTICRLIKEIYYIFIDLVFEMKHSVKTKNIPESSTSRVHVIYNSINFLPFYIKILHS